MIKKNVLILIVFSFIFSPAYSAEIPTDLFAKFVNIKGAYLGQEPPGLIPKLFAPFLLDYKKHHIHSAPVFSPEGDEMYFSAYVEYQFPQRIFYTKMSKDGVWSKPEVVSFSGVYQEGGPKMSPDGKRIYFYSRRPFKDGNPVRKESLIFYSEREKDGWSKAIRLNVPEGLGLANYPSHFGKDGSLYFRVKMGKKSYKIFKGFIIGNNLTSVVEMERPVTFDPKYMTQNPIDWKTLDMIYNDEYLIQNSIDWKTFEMIFLISAKKKDGSWTKSRPMGDTINGRLTQVRFSAFSPDGKYFFFASYVSGHERLYWVSTKIFDICLKYDLNLVNKLSFILEKKGIEPTQKEFNKQKASLSEYYQFSKKILNYVAYGFLAKGKSDLVLKSLKLNFSLYPKENFIIEKLLFSVLKKEKNLFNKCKHEFMDKKGQVDIQYLDKINVLAYEIMNGGFLDEAVAVYQLNTYLFPKSSKVFDRLGRAYSGKKNIKEAIKAYKKALELDPKNQNAIKALEELKKK